MSRRIVFAVAACALLAAAVWWVAFRTGHGGTADARILRDLAVVQDSRAEPLLQLTAFLCNVAPYALLALLVGIVAYVQRGPRGALVIAAVVVGANAVTQVLKDTLAEDRVPGAGTTAVHVDPASWPSGHATASLVLVLCALLVAPRAARPVVAAVGAVFTAGVALAVVALGWHFPSDVVGGWLVALVGAGVGAACLPSAARLPEGLVWPVRAASEDEQQVRQPV